MMGPRDILDAQLSHVAVATYLVAPHWHSFVELARNIYGPSLHTLAIEFALPLTPRWIHGFDSSDRPIPWDESPGSWVERTYRDFTNFWKKFPHDHLEQTREEFTTETIEDHLASIELDVSFPYAGLICGTTQYPAIDGYPIEYVMYWALKRFLNLEGDTHAL